MRRRTAARRAADVSTANAGRAGEAALYFGCRRRDTDGLYLDELDAARADGVLTRFAVAESRIDDAQRVAGSCRSVPRGEGLCARR